MGWLDPIKASTSAAQLTPSEDLVNQGRVQGEDILRAILAPDLFHIEAKCSRLQCLKITQNLDYLFLYRRHVVHSARKNKTFIGNFKIGYCMVHFDGFSLSVLWLSIPSWNILVLVTLRSLVGRSLRPR